VIERVEWEHKAGWAASYRETTEHDDQVDALGATPAAGEVERRALFASAHEQLGLPDRDAQEADLTNGQLRCRVAAFEHERAWAPRYVGDELGEANRQAADREADAVLWSAHADRATSDVERDMLRADADTARIEAESLRERITDLETVDDARSAWVVETAKTQDLYDRSRVELAARGVDRDAEPLVTAAEWMAEHEHEQADGEPSRDVFEADVSEDTDDVTLTDADDDGPALETGVPDIRDSATPDATETTDAEPGRVPDVDETAAAVGRAQDALAEMSARDEYDTSGAGDDASDVADSEDTYYDDTAGSDDADGTDDTADDTADDDALVDAR